MRPPRLWLALVLCCSFAITLVAQNPSSSTPQALSTLQSALQALTGNTATTDATLTGTASWFAGSDDETGTVVLKTISGANRLDLSLSAGTRSEIRTGTVSGSVVGTWIGPDRVSHAMMDHNLMTDAGWFPAFTIGNLRSASNVVATYIGVETRNGSSVVHISASQQFSSLPSASAALLQHLTKVDIYLDPSTLLPVSYVYNSHPDDNAMLDIPTEIRYSNYQTITGAQVPFRVQKFISSTLILDLQFQNASLNTGLTSTQITAQ
jgi:hypothetical protein